MFLRTRKLTEYRPLSPGSNRSRAPVHGDSIGLLRAALDRQVLQADFDRIPTDGAHDSVTTSTTTSMTSSMTTSDDVYDDV